MFARETDDHRYSIIVVSAEIKESESLSFFVSGLSSSDLTIVNRIVLNRYLSLSHPFSTAIYPSCLRETDFSLQASRDTGAEVGFSVPFKGNNKYERLDDLTADDKTMAKY